MVTVVPPEQNGWADVFESIGKGASEGYQERSDQMSIQKAVESLPANHTPKDLLNVLIPVKTYKPESKSNFFKNYLGVSEFGETQRKNKRAEELTEAEIAGKTAVDKEKTTQTQLKETGKENRPNKKEQDELAEVQSLGKIVYPNETPEKIAEKTKGLKPADLRSLIVKPEKPENVTEYEVAKNQSKRLEPLEKEISEAGEGAKRLLPATEIAIMNNEKYTPTERILDQAIEASGSKFFKLFKSVKGQQLLAYTPFAIQALAEKMGGVLSVKKLNILEQKAAAPDKSKETNRLFLYLDLFDRKLDVMRQKLTNDLIKKNKYGLIPIDLNEEIDKKIKPFQKMIDRDIQLLIDGKKPKSPMSSLATTENKRARAPEGKTEVYDQEGNSFYLDSNLLGTKGYEDLQPL